MTTFYIKSKKPLALTTLCLLLGACGGGSNNIIEDPTSTDVDVPVECASTERSCVDLVFDDTPVANLNYECGKYRGVTSNTGVARCPIDSNVNFYLKATGGIRQVNLGTFSIKSVRSRDPSESQDTSLIRVGVKELAENTTRSSMVNLNEGIAATTAINISRLLQALGRTSEPYINTAPVNRIYIDNDVKADIEKLSKNIDAKDFQDDIFEEKLTPWFEAQKRVLLDEATAKARLEKHILAIKSGVFFSTPTATLDLGEQLGSTSLDLGISGSSNTNERASVALFSLADRVGQGIGYGLQWTGPFTSTQDTYKLFITSNFAKMRVNGTDSQSVINPYTNRVTDTSFKVGPKAYSTSGGNQNNNDTFSFINGKLIRDLGVLGSANIYEFYTGVKLEDQTELGTWQQKTQTGTTSFTGNATLFKTGAVNTYLDPAVWRTKDSVKSGTYLFPLYATLTFNYGSEYIAECKKQGLECGTAASLPVVFLENGDIMTNGAAMPVNSQPMCKSANDSSSTVTQTRIGTVRAAYSSTDGNQSYISPSIILSGDQFGILDGTQIGTSALSPRVKINLAGIKQVAAGQNGTINITSAEGADAASGSATALWANGYNTFTSIRVAQRQAEIDSTTTVEKPSPDVTNEQKLAAKLVQGVLLIKTSSCYEVEQK